MLERAMLLTAVQSEVAVTAHSASFTPTDYIQKPHSISILKNRRRNFGI
jgi:hypothetical protein